MKPPKKAAPKKSMKVLKKPAKKETTMKRPAAKPLQLEKEEPKEEHGADGEAMEEEEQMVKDKSKDAWPTRRQRA